MTRVDMEAVERMLNEATPGPWHVNLPGIEDDIRDGDGGYVATAFGAHNATLIAAAPTLIRALIEEVRGLREAMPTDEERIAIGNRLRHDYDRRYPGDALVDHVKAIDWLARIEAARSR